MKNKYKQVKIFIILSIVAIILILIGLVVANPFERKIPLGNNFIANVSIYLYNASNTLMSYQSYILNTTVHPELVFGLCSPDNYLNYLSTYSSVMLSFGVYHYNMLIIPIEYPTYDGKTPCFTGWYGPSGFLVIENTNKTTEIYNLTKIDGGKFFSSQP